MASKVKYVVLRKGWFQYHRRVPTDIVRDAAALERYFNGDKLFRRALGTNVADEVFETAAERQREFEQLVAAARGVLHVPAARLARRSLRTVTKDVIADIKAFHHATTARPWIQAYVHSEQDAEEAEHFQRMIDDRELFAERRKHLLMAQGARARRAAETAPIDVAEEHIESLGLDAPPGSPERSMISIAVREGILAGEQDIDRVIQGEMPQLPQVPSLRRAEEQSGPTLRDAVDRYLADTKVTPKTEHEIKTSLQLFETMIGHKELAELQRRDFTDFVVQLATKQIGGRSEGSIPRMIGPGTVKKRLGFLRTAINHAIECEMSVGGNPAAGIKIGGRVRAPDPAIMPKKRPFKVSELNLVFEHPWFTGCLSRNRSHEAGEVRLTGAHYWAPVVALFTGCRAAELGGLKLNEIHLSGPHPHIHIRDNEYRRTKGGYARFVPLLDALLELGFGEYVEAIRARGNDRLFPDWQSPKSTGNFDKDDAAWSNASVIRAFNRTVIKHRLGEVLPADARREVTFHSFRGAFKSMISRSRFGININAINDVIGHAKLREDPRYVDVPIEESHEALHACRWDDLVVPSAPPLP